MSKHRVRTHHWVDGVLKTEDLFFKDFEQAFNFSRHSNAHHVKIYDNNDFLVYDSKPNAPETYA